MARKVFISVLGAGFYAPCKYFKDQFISCETRFIQEATLNFLGAKQWNQNDTALFLLTESARNNNWETVDSERKNNITGQKEKYVGLNNCISNLNLPFEHQEIAIPDGKNEEEMWQIFNTLYKSLQEDDELYFDLTHSFRYLPMLVLVFGNYAKFLKHAQIMHISYGNYEARDRDSNSAPIIDLLPLSSLQDWASASASFLETGSVSLLNKLCKRKLTPILRDEKLRENNPSAENLKKYVDTLEKVVSDMNGCRGVNILKGVNISEMLMLSTQVNDMIIEPMNPILEKVMQSFNGFKPSQDIINGYLSAKWCLEHKLFQQSLTILHENIVSHICETEGIDKTDIESRDSINKAFNICNNNIKETEWKIKNEQEKEFIENLLQKELFKKLASSFLVTTNLRNDYNHAGMNNSPSNVSKIEIRLKERVDKILDIVTQHNSHAN